MTKSSIPPCENCEGLKEQLERQKERMAALAGDKANLELMFDILSSVTQLSGIENIARRTLDCLMNTLGGINHHFYYRSDENWVHLDAFGKHEIFEHLEDLDSRRAVETQKFWGGPCDPIHDSLRLTFDISKGQFEKWIFPLIVEGEVLGVIKTEGLLVHANDSIVSRLNVIANYVSLVIKNENLNLFKLQQANEALIRKNEQLQMEIAQRIAAEREKDVLHSRLQQSRKMEAIGTLAGGIAHNFNNLLGVIMGYVDMALDDSDNESVRHKLQQVVIASERAKELVKQILTFSRSRDVEKSPVSISQTVQDAMALMRATIPSTIHMRVETEPGLPAVFANENQLHQVIMNLCSNAKHAMEEGGGCLTVRLYSFSDTDRIRKINMEIADTGEGIAPEVLPRIFEPYFTTKEVGKGMGMGLAVVHGIVESFDGKITVSSEMGKGTTFTCTFPICRTGLSKTVPEQHTEKEFSGRALVVDDEEIVAGMARQMLTKMGFTVEVFGSSTDALETFKHDPDRFDLVMTDHTMPDLTGLGLAKQMLEIRKVPIVVSSGYSDIIEKQKYQEYGVSGFIGKPYKYRELEQLLRSILG